MQAPDSKRIKVEASPVKENVLRKQRDAMKADRDAIKATRDAIKADRDEIKAEKDVIKADREAIKVDREAIKADRDAIKADRDTIKADRDTIKADRDAIEADRDAIKADRDTVKADRDAIKTDRDTTKTDRDAIKLDRDAMKEARDELTMGKKTLEEKYNSLRSKLLERVECPVCIEVPTSGPVYACPNGHLVCSNCKDAKCPTCRSKMFDRKSLLAVTFIENIEHKCLYEGCGKLFPLDIFKNHLKSCPHRVVHCPAATEVCDKEIELSKLYSHILQDCKGACNNMGNINTTLNNGEFPKTLNYDIGGRGVIGIAFYWNRDVYLYLSSENLQAYTVFSVQHFGNAEECQKYVVTLTVHNPNRQAMNGINSHKWTSEPLPIDNMKQEERRENGLLVGSKQLEKLVAKRENGFSMVGISIDIQAKESCQKPLQGPSTSRPSAIVMSS